METRECFGWPVAASALTEVLLWIEDRLDLNESAFVRLVGAREILNRMNGGRDLQGEDVVIYTASIAATLTGACCDQDILAVSSQKVVRVLNEIAADNGANTLILKEKSALIDDPVTRQSRKSAVQKELNDDADLEQVEQEIIKRRTELIVSYAAPTLSKRLYDKVARVWGKPIVLVQLPYTESVNPVAGVNDCLVNAKLHTKLALLALSGRLSSENR